MKKILVILVCVVTGLTVANPVLWAHGGGGGSSSGGAGGGGAGAADGGGNGGSGSHGGGEGHGGGMGHGVGFSLGPSHAENAISTHRGQSQFAGHKGANHHGRGFAAHSRSSHFTVTRHSIAHNHHFVRASSSEKALPPGIELNVDRGKALPRSS